ncbi:hypothetical protein C5C36_01750 [Rathayibacter sp. AY1G1]|nr:hypothetical protein C5C36_01750 [Rathayibacter sp. AY1G1]
MPGPRRAARASSRSRYAAGSGAPAPPRGCPGGRRGPADRRRRDARGPRSRNVVPAEEPRARAQKESRVPTECIHGLDIALCDVCTPKKLPEQVGRATRAPARVPGTSRAATARAAARGTAREKPLPKVDIAAQRIYHVTHLDNLEAIVAAGAILADQQLQERPAIDVSAETTREHRRAVQVKDGVSVAGFVPFFLSPDAALWADLRGERVAPHWSPSAHETTASQYVVLVGSLASAPVLSDGDASHVLTRFTEGDALVRTFARLLVDEPALRSAEALVPERFPLEGVATVGVASVAARNRVKALFEGIDASPRVAVYPPWFHPVAEEE